MKFSPTHTAQSHYSFDMSGSEIHFFTTRARKSRTFPFPSSPTPFPKIRNSGKTARKIGCTRIYICVYLCSVI